MEIMTADEARKKSSSVTNAIAQAELERFAVAIDRATVLGSRAAQVNFCASVSVVRELERLGFTVKKWSDQRDGDYTQVSW